jgi:hypothetical protein
VTGPTTVSGEKLTAERPEAWAVARPAGTGNLVQSVLLGRVAFSLIQQCRDQDQDPSDSQHDADAGC